MQSKSLSVEHHTVFMRTASHKSSKHTLLFVHGIGASSRYWIPLAWQLKGEYNLYMPDMPGYGKSSRSHNAPTLHELADVLHGIIKLLRLTNVTLIGNSYGCQIIIDMLYRYHPSEVRKAILLGPTIYDQERSMKTQIVRLLQDGQREPSWSILILLRDYIDAGFRRMHQSLQHAMHDRPEEKLHSIHIPVLVVRGEEDVIVPHEWAQEITTKLPKGQLIEVPDSGHGVHIATPAITAAIVRNFTDSFVQKVQKKLRRAWA
jgi:2-hydroxy-6-oxonona-2,4-dienedioate hydrolase